MPLTGRWRRLLPARRELFWLTLGLGLGAAITWHMRAELEREPGRLYGLLAKNPGLLVEHPDLVEGAAALSRSRRSAAIATERATLLSGKWGAFIRADSTPAIGNPQGNKIIVEFTDYACEPCRPSARALRLVLADDPNLRVAIMLLPTAGPVAEFAARAAFAAQKQNPSAFAAFHHGLMEGEQVLSQDAIMKLAEASGLDPVRLLRDSADIESRGYRDLVREFAADLGVIGVPAFAYEERLLAGGVDEARLREFLR